MAKHNSYLDTYNHVDLYTIAIYTIAWYIGSHAYIAIGHFKISELATELAI